MIATLLGLAGYLLCIALMVGLSVLVFQAAMSAFPSLAKKEYEGFVFWIAAFLAFVLKDTSWLALNCMFPSTLFSSASEMIATLAGLTGYLVHITCIMGLTFFVVGVVIDFCIKPLWPDPKKHPDWSPLIVMGISFVVTDMLMKHFRLSDTMPMICGLAGYLFYIVFMMGLWLLVFVAAAYAFPSLNKDYESFAFPIAASLAFVLKDMLWLALISGFPSTLPPSASEMIATLAVLAGYLVYITCTMGLTFFVVGVVIDFCINPLSPDPKKGSDWFLLIVMGISFMVTDMLIKHFRLSDTMSMLCGLAGYIFYIVFMMELLLLVFVSAASAFPSLDQKEYECFVFWIAASVAFVLKDTLWLALISGFPSTMPSSASEMIATLAGYLIYITCMMGLMFFVVGVVIDFCIKPLWPDPKKRPDWFPLIVIGISVVATDMLMKHFCLSDTMATLCGLAGYLFYIVFMMGLWLLVFVAAAYTFPSLNKEEYEGFVFPIAAVLAFMLKDTLWLALISGFPSTLPSTVSEMIATLVGLAGYLVYIMCITGLSVSVIYVVMIFCIEPLWPRSTLPGWVPFIILGATFLVMDMLMKHFSVSDTMATLLGLAANLVRMITTSLLALLALSFLMALSFLAVMVMCAWVTILLPSATNSYPRLMFASIVGITFMVMKNMFELGTPVDQSVLVSASFSTSPSIFIRTNATLVGLTIFINNYRIAYLVMRYATLLVLFFLPLVSNSMTTFAKYTKAAVIITLAIVLTMQPSAMPIENPTLIFESPSSTGASNLALDDFIGVSEQPSVEQKMVMEMIVLGFNMLIKESKRAVQTIFIHKNLILTTLIGGMVFFLWILYRFCKYALTEKSKQLLEGRVPLSVDTPTEKGKELPEDRVSALVDTLDEKSDALTEKAASEVYNLVQDQKHRSSCSFGGISNDPRNSDVQLMDSIYYGDEESVVTREGSAEDDSDQVRSRIHMQRESSPLLVPGREKPYDEFEKALQDLNATPMSFPLEFLKAITRDFSTELELGEGGFGVVYKGILRNRNIIAVKKLFELRIKEETFRNEVRYLIGIKHENVVQLLGYCAESRWQLTKQLDGDGKHIFAEIPNRLLCFEYVPNKSLHNHISVVSSGLEWSMRYKIIKRICNGLHFLHEECRMVHLDLKPENILMDSTMTPKIADFGLSKIFGEQQSRIVTENKVGTRGYMAPEYFKDGVVSYKADIFSLGVIVIEIITGGKDYPYFQQESPHPHRTDSSFEQYTERVLGSWRNKFGSTREYKPTEKYTQQVKKCITIALKCVDPDMQKRPTVKYIIEVLNEADQL